jgi:hypothetical protein
VIIGYQKASSPELSALDFAYVNAKLLVLHFFEGEFEVLTHTAEG